MTSTGLGPAWFAIHFDSLLIRNRINQWFASEWITIHLPLIFDSQVNHDSRVNRDSRRNKIKPYQKFWFKMYKIKLNHESKWIVNQNESKSESNWITDIFFLGVWKIFDSSTLKNEFFSYFSHSFEFTISGQKTELKFFNSKY